MPPTVNNLAQEATNANSDHAPMGNQYPIEFHGLRHMVEVARAAHFPRRETLLPRHPADEGPLIFQKRLRLVQRNGEKKDGKAKGEPKPSQTMSCVRLYE